MICSTRVKKLKRLYFSISTECVRWDETRGRNRVVPHEGLDKVLAYRYLWMSKDVAYLGRLRVSCCTCTVVVFSSIARAFVHGFDYLTTSKSQG